MNNFPAWSPDGSQIVWERDTTGDGDSDLWVMPRTGEPETPITFEHAFDTCPAWSPDGTRIAFQSRHRSGNTDIWVMPATGGPATQLTFNPDFDGSPAWSPDGTQIVFASRRNGQQTALWVMPATGEPATQLTFPVHPLWDHSPDWSPDGTRIAFTSSGSSNWVWILTLPTTGVEPGVAPAIQDLSLAIDPHPVARQLSAVRFELQVAAPIRLALYGCDGRAMDVLASGNRASGGHRIEWDARGVAAGVYFLRLETDGASATRKVVVLDR
jgi:Tol biopolymer transport system component